jgi:tRNA-dihydrouridine synthase B
MNKTLQIGPYRLGSRVLLAPMAGITDAPFRQLCEKYDAGLSVTEMTTADTRLWSTEKSRRRLRFHETNGIRAVQIAGSDAGQMARATRAIAEQGAQIIDINMGCPAKKVCRKLAGSALLRNETQVESILRAVVQATDLPVTLKMRTGWDSDNRNGVRIAKLAESSGVQAITVHGRTRACGFRGHAEYETIRAIKSSVAIPVIANGDIVSPGQAQAIIRYTGADGVMIGRASRGRPWLIKQISDHLSKKEFNPPPSIEARRDIILCHLDAMYRFYGEYTGVRVARKHLGWYLQGFDEAQELRQVALRTSTATSQMQVIRDFFSRCLKGEEAATAECSPPGVSHQWRKVKQQVQRDKRN